MATSQVADKTDLLNKGVKLEYISIGMSMIGAAIAGTTGVTTGSIALFAFGMDSFIGIGSAGMLLWRLRRELQEQKIGEAYTSAERKVLFGIGVACFLLALYILNESGSKLYYLEKPEPGSFGLALSVLFLVVMPVLAVMKFRASRGLDSRALRAEARGTAVSAYLAFILSLGLGLNIWLGWWWVDAVAALLMLPFIVREGWEMVEESKKEISRGSGSAKASP